MMEIKNSIETLKKDEENKQKKIKILEGNMQKSQEELEAFQVKLDAIIFRIFMNFKFSERKAKNIK